MTRDLVIGLDSSTTATKAIAWDRNGHALAEGRAPIALSNPQAGWFEQEAQDWWASAQAAIRSLLDKVELQRIVAIAISNQRESFAQFDAEGNALRPGTLWLDERAVGSTGFVDYGTFLRESGRPFPDRAGELRVLGPLELDPPSDG